MKKGVVRGGDKGFFTGHRTATHPPLYKIVVLCMKIIDWLAAFYVFAKTNHGSRFADGPCCNIFYRPLFF